MSALISTSEYDESITGWPKFRMVHGSGKASAEVRSSDTTPCPQPLVPCILAHSLACCAVWRQIYLNGATVVSWRVVDQELLFVSPKNDFTVGRAVRGGIPVVFRQPFAATLSLAAQPAVHPPTAAVQPHPHMCPAPIGVLCSCNSSVRSW